MWMSELGYLPYLDGRPRSREPIRTSAGRPVINSGRRVSEYACAPQYRPLAATLWTAGVVTRDR